MAHLTMGDVAEAVKANPALKDRKLMIPHRQYPGGFCACENFRVLDTLKEVVYCENDHDAILAKWTDGMEVVVPLTFGDRLLRAVLQNEDDGTWQEIVRTEANRLDREKWKLTSNA